MSKIAPADPGKNKGYSEEDMKKLRRYSLGESIKKMRKGEATSSKKELAAIRKGNKESSILKKIKDRGPN